ncbi:DNA-3-methyladenine glycosylase family protein [Nocardioides terrisoli]|uniref:DNA-3-methyladenine glycosylase family protein n=1 Tax=Nocardioides terrisoli TaxID=3388267 RepID=UPI00287B8C1A|nr:DNA-3-methyladenine glycosylase 2 family protein [Nocardioides marmorisolisilvae]
MTSPTERRWQPGWPCSLAAALAPYRHGAGDPTYRVAPDGAHWRGIRTPVGTATLRLSADEGGGTVSGAAWGAGAEWALDTMPRLLGAEDDPSGFRPRHDVIERAWRRHGHLRIGASGLVMESLVPAVIEQKVTGQEAFGAYRGLVRRFGEPAPGPGADLGLLVQPSPTTLRSIASWDWIRLPVDRARSTAVLRAARVADGLERAGARGATELDRALCSVPGIGRWTSAEVRVRSQGDADAVSFGDYHVARDVGWALTGAEVDDDGLEELLEEYRPHRHRVQRLVVAAGLGRPRRGPRMAPRVHLPK